ncbi:MAG: putative Type IV pilus pilin [Parcubacteria bacterium C7867-003]|nr:MAG: putative Type IV pilus pilin [Parcubacteria bacterium C7867-003]
MPNKKAFTLVELLVSVSIIGVITSVVFWNYGDFNDQLALSAAAQELALDIREAQTYGINVKESGVGSNQYTYGYGVHIIAGGGTGYRTFIDNNPANNQYEPNAGCSTVSLPATECIRRVDFRNGINVTNVCDATTCPAAGASRMNIVFIRPNPDAIIYFASGLNNFGPVVSSARIQLTSPKGNVKYVKIESTGQVSIQ